jgi:hypothetical protein
MNVTEIECGSEAWIVLVSAARQADETERKLSLCLDTPGHVQIKLGEGMWTPPLPLTVS